MDKNKKVFRKSGASIACYIFAAIILIYTCYTAGNTANQVDGYYAQYGLNAPVSDYVIYIAQNIIPYLFYAVATFMFGYILDAVRRTDPKNYMTEEEYREAKIAKKEARDAKKIAKGEKKVAAKAAKASSDEQSMAEDFASDLDKELKAAEKKNENKRPGNNNGYKRNYNQNRNGNNNHRQSGNKNGGNRNGNGNGNRKNNKDNNQNGDRNNNHNNDQSKLVTEEKKAADNKDRSFDVFEAKVVEDK